MANEFIEAVDKLGEKIDSRHASQLAEIKAVKDDFDKKQSDYEKEVKALNDDVLKKGATIEQLQNDVREMKAKSGKTGNSGSEHRTIITEIKQAILDNKDAFINLEKGESFKPFEVKAVANIATANITAGHYLTYLGWQDGMEPIGQERFRSLVRTISSDTDIVRYPRANKPIGEGSFARQTEAASKAQVDRDYTMVSLSLSPMAGYAVVSRQALRNITFLQSWLPTSMLEQLQDQEDVDFTNTLYAGATGNNAVVGTTIISKIGNYVKVLKQSKYVPNAIAVSPDIWVSLILTTAATSGEYSLPNVVTVDANGVTRILGIPVIMWNQLVGNQVIVGDFRKAAIVQSEGLTIRQSDSHASTFTTNEVTFLMERVEGLAIFRPDAFISNYL